MNEPRVEFFSDFIKNWQALEAFLASAGSLSLRLGLGPGSPAFLDYSVDADVEPTDFDLRVIGRIHGAYLQIDASEECDSLYVSRDVVIATSTADCREIDKALHRRSDLIGEFDASGTEAGLSEPGLAALLELSAHTSLFTDDEAVDVYFHDMCHKVTRVLSYAGSFAVEAALIRGCPLAKQLALEPDEVQASLVCDLHEDRGHRSFTISRLAQTLEGIHRVIVFNTVLSPKGALLP